MKGKVNEEMDLGDEIWADRKNLPIYELELEQQLSKVKSKLSTQGGRMDDQAELTEKNKRIQWHLNNADQVLSEAKKRRINQYSQVQEEIYSKKVLNSENKSIIKDLLTNSPDDSDKMRLMLQVLLCCEHSSSKDVQELEAEFPGAKKNKLYSELKAKVFREEGDDKLQHGKKYLKKFAKGLWNNLMVSDMKYLLTSYA